jgi:hypothetical protein
MAFPMIKPLQAVLVATALAGCATEDQNIAPVDAWRDCVMSTVKRVDDRQTNPMSEASAISPMCAAVYDKFRQSRMSAMPTRQAQESMSATLKEGESRMIVSAIVAHRARQRNQQKASR